MFFNDCNNVAHNVVLHVCFRIFLFFYDFTFTFFLHRSVSMMWSLQQYQAWTDVLNVWDLLRH